MKPVAVLYTTREGHTRRIAEQVAADLRKRKIGVDVLNVRDELVDIDVDHFSAAILAASVHGGRHEREMVKFVKRHKADLDQLPTAFLSITLSEAGVERVDGTPEERAEFAAGVREVLDRFFHDTGWQPKHVKAVAGALMYSQYNPLIRFVMKRIARSTGADTDTSRDYDYTDWVAIDHFADALADEILAGETMAHTSG